MLKKLFGLLWSTRVALVLLVLILFSCIVGASLPAAIGREAVFSSLWFNFLLVLLIVNIVFCIFKRIRILRLSLIGTTIFHLSLVLLFAGVVYDQLFFFEGAIRLTEGEALSCAERASYDWVRKGRFFKIPKLEDLGKIYLHKVHTSHLAEGRDWGSAYEIAVRGDPVSSLSTGQAGTGQAQGSPKDPAEKKFIYVNHPLKYMGFEFYRDKEGYSPLFVLRDSFGRVLYGAYAPLQSIEQKDGTYIYRSGTADEPGGFFFPKYQNISPVLKLQTVYHPDKTKGRTGEVFFQVWKVKSHSQESSEEKLFNGKVKLGERIRVGEYFLSMDEVRYWAATKVIYRPGLAIIFSSFWIGLGGITLSVILKMAKGTST